MNTRAIKRRTNERRRNARIRKIIVEGVLFISLMLIGISSFANWLEGDIPLDYKGDYTTYIVSKGDRLWNIAEQFSDGKDIREVVYTIEKDNGLDSAELSIGQQLQIRNEY